MKTLRSFLFLLMSYTLLVSHGLHAKTCAEKLIRVSKMAIAGAVLTLPFPLLWGPTVFLSRDAIVMRKTAKRLVAASIIANGSLEHEESAAHNIIDEFYAKLVRRYPELKMSKAEVVDLLDKINSYQLGMNACNILKFGGGLSQEFFPEKRRDEWLAALTRESERAERELAAAKIREEKNRLAPISVVPKQNDDVMVDIE